MDHRHYRYRAAPNAERWRLPGHQRVAAFVVVHLEHWEIGPPEEVRRDARFAGEFGSFFPDFRTWTQREYGLRVGIFRLLDALDAVGLVPAVAIDAVTAERLPRLVDEFVRRGAEFLAHGVSADRLITSRMPAAEEHALIASSVHAIHRATGMRPRGWCSPGFSESVDTPANVAAAGLDYLLDWPNDERPYWLDTEPAIVSMPNQADWDDVETQWLRRVKASTHAKMLVEALGELAVEGRESPRVFGLGLHPWLAGMASRIRYTREALAGMAAVEGVWWTLPGAIAKAWREQVPPAPR